MSWRRTVEKLAARDGLVCRYCGCELVLLPVIPAGQPIPYRIAPGVISDVPKPTIDHAVPLTRDGSNDLANKVLACAPCNIAKGARTAAKFIGAAV